MADQVVELPVKRMISPTAILFVMACNALAGIYTSPPGNLIVNGSFENGFSGWAGTMGLYNSPNPVSGSTVGMVIDIWGSSVNQCMSQTITTVPGTLYQIAFGIRLPELYQITPGTWVPVVGDSGGASTTIAVQWNGSNISNIPVTSRNWTFYTVDVVASTSSSMLTFFNGPGSQAWPFVDDVSITAVPEPGSMGLSLLFLASYCGMRTRRTKA